MDGAGEEPVRAAAGWLELREPADAAARARTLVEALPWHPGPAPAVVHDLGGGSGSMARWLAPLLPGPQRWVLHDRDVELLALAPGRPPGRAADGALVEVETREDDVTRLDHGRLAGAALVTASALLDMLTAPELDRLLDAATAPGCPVLLALSVTGEVVLEPAHPLDRRIGRAFDAHQHRPTGGDPRLGPDAWSAAAAGLTARGFAVTVETTPWRLGPDHPALLAAWADGWLGAALEQDPSLVTPAASWARARADQQRAGALRATVGHRDLLALPRERP
ncbi:SAM-dependent methyltransferase [Nocardioides aestuarii]|uniref:Class I SAM-dependent methyltransferase n=1 Tax=Nocardioides aestuarii TaxID=252231 RepID=A0ABW4TLV6_9ACTN